MAHPSTRHHHPPRARRLPAARPASQTADGQHGEHRRRAQSSPRAAPSSADSVRRTPTAATPNTSETIVAPASTCSISSTKPTRYTSRPDEQDRERREQRREQHDANRRRRANRPAPAVESSGRFRSPDAGCIPEPRRAVERGERSAAGADTMSGEDVDLDAGFLQRAEHARVVRTVRASARQNQGRAAFR